jgi:hypothetical protein
LVACQDGRERVRDRDRERERERGTCLAGTRQAVSSSQLPPTCEPGRHTADRARGRRGGWAQQDLEPSAALLRLLVTVECSVAHRHATTEGSSLLCSSPSASFSPLASDMGKNEKAKSPPMHAPDGQHTPPMHHHAESLPAAQPRTPARCPGADRKI